MVNSLTWTLNDKTYCEKERMVRMLQRAVNATKGVERAPGLWIYTIFGVNTGRSTMGNFKHVPVWTFLARRRRSGASLCWSVLVDSEGGSSR